MPIDGYFDTTFAENGDLNTIPDDTQPSGTVSYNQGFPVLYSTAVASGGYNVPRTAFNQVLNDITTAIQFQQQGNAAPFITTVMNGGTPYSYPQYAEVLYGGVVYRSNANSNTDTPPTSKWVALPLLPAIVKINSIAISTSGTYTPSAGLLFAVIEVSGGGGGGGGAAGAGTGSAAGAGGGGGGYARGVFSAATIGSSQTVTIGAGGSAGTAGNHPGNSGGTTSVGSLISATGGTGGAGCANATTPQFTSGGQPGSGGAGTGGTVFVSGIPGGVGISLGTNPTEGMAGAGGSSFYGNPGGSFSSGTGSAGSNAAGTGAGGSGGVAIASSVVGGTGHAGIVYITEYCSQ